VIIDFGATAAHLPSVSCYKTNVQKIILGKIPALTSALSGFHL
jgi:hypothetical protein